MGDNTRGISLEWALRERIAELAGENHVKWNRMAVVLIEMGLPVFRNVRERMPALARAILESKRYHYVKRRRASEVRLEEIQESESKKIRLDARIYAGVPQYYKDDLKREAKRRGIYQSQIIREKQGLTF
jgi:hypothetical protein